MSRVCYFSNSNEKEPADAKCWPFLFKNHPNQQVGFGNLLALTQRGLSPLKKRQPSLGALTAPASPAARVRETTLATRLPESAWGRQFARAERGRVQAVVIPPFALKATPASADNAITRRHARTDTRNEDTFQLCQPMMPERRARGVSGVHVLYDVTFSSVISAVL